MVWPITVSLNRPLHDFSCNLLIQSRVTKPIKTCCRAQMIWQCQRFTDQASWVAHGVIRATLIILNSFDICLGDTMMPTVKHPDGHDIIVYGFEAACPLSVVLMQQSRISSPLKPLLLPTVALTWISNWLMLQRKLSPVSPTYTPVPGLKASSSSHTTYHNFTLFTLICLKQCWLAKKTVYRNGMILLCFALIPSWMISRERQHL